MSLCVFSFDFVPDAFTNSSSDRGLPAEYKAASILAAISYSGRAGSRKVCIYLFFKESIYYFIALLSLLYIYSYNFFCIVTAIPLFVKAGRESSLCRLNLLLGNPA